MSVTTLKAPRISGRDRVIVLPNGKVALQSKGRRRYRLSASKRKRIAASLRRFKLPVLTTAAIAVGTWEPLKFAAGGDFQRAGKWLMRNYTGFDLDAKNWKFNRLWGGLLPIIAVVAINRSGLLKHANQKLARMRIPLRLS